MRRYKLMAWEDIRYFFLHRQWLAGPCDRIRAHGIISMKDQTELEWYDYGKFITEEELNALRNRQYDKFGRDFRSKSTLFIKGYFHARGEISNFKIG